MKQSKLIKRLAATFVIVVLGGPAAVLADTHSNFEDAKVRVSYADLNLENEEGVRVLYQRLQDASKEICNVGSLRHGGSIMMKFARSQCYRETLSNAVDKFDNGDLTRIHAR